MDKFVIELNNDGYITTVIVTLPDVLANMHEMADQMAELGHMVSTVDPTQANYDGDVIVFNST